MREREANAGNEPGAGAQVSEEKHKSATIFPTEGVVNDLVVKPAKEPVKAILPPEVRAALGIREAEHREKPPTIIVVNPGQKRTAGSEAERAHLSGAAHTSSQRESPRSTQPVPHKA